MTANEAQQRSNDRASNKRPYVHRNRAVDIPDGYMAVGQIIGVHGLRGEIKVALHTDYPERFAAGGTLLVGSGLAPIVVQRSRPHKGHMLLMLEGVSRRSEAESLRGQWVFVDEAEAAELDDDTYWIHDIVGLQVISRDGRRLGEIQDVLQTGANDVYIVRTEPDVNGGRELLLPAIASVIQEIDLEAGTMVVNLPPGLESEE